MSLLPLLLHFLVNTYFISVGCHPLSLKESWVSEFCGRHICLRAQLVFLQHSVVLSFIVRQNISNISFPYSLPLNPLRSKILVKHLAFKSRRQ